MRFARVALVVIAVVCFGVALSYPIRYRLAQRSNDSDMRALSDMRTRVQEQAGATTAVKAAVDAIDSTEAPEATEAATVVEATDATETAAAVIDDATTAPTATGAADVPGTAETIPAAPDATQPPGATEAPDATGTPGEAVEPVEPQATDAPVEMVVTDAIEAAIMKGRAIASATAEPKGEADAPEAIDAPIATDAGAPVEAASVEKTGATTVEPSQADGEEPPEPTAVTVTASTTDISATTEEAGKPPSVEPSPEEPTPAPTPTPSPTPGIMDLILDYEPWPTMVPIVIRGTPTPDPNATPTPAPTFDIEGFTGALPYSLKEKVTLDEDAILPELKDIYALNHDLVGWITIPDTVVDYPVVQRPADSDFYLTHDFYGEENQNGQIILDPLCDPYTPSYNLVISGHHMKNGSMFGSLTDYRTVSFWRKHMFLEFDTLMARKRYVVFAAFYSADYDEDEAGFRYNANVRYRMDADPWLSEIRENQLYDTGIDVKFGDEFITLTTCHRARHRNGRFVVVCRRIREGETFE